MKEIPMLYRAMSISRVILVWFLLFNEADAFVGPAGEVRVRGPPPCTAALSNKGLVSTSVSARDTGVVRGLRQRWQQQQKEHHHQQQRRRRQQRGTELFVTNSVSEGEGDVEIEIEIDERLREEDPIEFISQEVNAKMDANAIFNTGIIVLVALSVLDRFATVDAGIMRGWSLEEMAIRIPFDNWNSYSAVLSAAPIQTKAVTSATVYAIGDFIAQRTEGLSMGELDRPRLVRSLLAGLIGHGPMSHVWYGFSENVVFQNVLHLPPNAFGTACKIVIDQTCWGPIWNNTYIVLLGLMKRNSLRTIFGEMKRTTIPLIVSGLKLWPLAHCVTYGLIPVENRLLWVDLVEIAWVTILATAAAAAVPENETENEIGTDENEIGTEPNRQQRKAANDE